MSRSQFGWHQKLKVEKNKTLKMEKLIEGRDVSFSFIGRHIPAHVIPDSVFIFGKTELFALEGLQNFFWRQGHILNSNADRIIHCIGDRRSNPHDPAHPNTLRTEGS